MDSEDIRSMVEDSLEETEATSEVVEQALHAHERARDLMRQGHFEEALARFRESLTAWERQADICRDQGFKNMWRSKPEQVGREMEDLRIAHLDVIDLGSFFYLRKRAELRREMLASVLGIATAEEGASESDIYNAFPPHQREDIRGILFHAQNRGWLKRSRVAGRYRISTTGSAPSVE
jgi:hypothetical protein